MARSPWERPPDDGPTRGGPKRKGGWLWVLAVVAASPTAGGPIASGTDRSVPGRTVIVDGAAHMMPMTHAEAVNNAVKAFLT